VTRRLHQLPNRFGAREDRHACPGCGRLTPRNQLACPTDWRRLPEPLRGEVRAAFAERPLSGRHVDAVGEAARWLRDNPTDGRRKAQTRRETT
jgi:hypothetical protein